MLGAVRNSGRRGDHRIPPDQQVRLRAYVARQGVHKAAASLHTSPTMIDKLLGGGTSTDAQRRILARLAELEKVA